MSRKTIQRLPIWGWSLLWNLGKTMKEFIGGWDVFRTYESISDVFGQSIFDLNYYGLEITEFGLNTNRSF